MHNSQFIFAKLNLKNKNSYTICMNLKDSHILQYLTGYT